MNTKTRWLGLWILAVLLAATPAWTDENLPRLRVGGLRWGPQVYRANEWAMVYSEVINPTDEPANLTLLTYFDADPNQRYGQTVWLPRRSRRQVIQPVRLPPLDVAPQYKMAGVTTMLLDESGFSTRELGREKSVLSYRGHQQVIVALASDNENELTSMVFHFERDRDREGHLAPTASEQNRRFLMRPISPLRAPFFVAGWDGVSAIVMATQQPMLDSAQTEALRQWVMRGGCLWLMMDRISTTYAAQILGEHFDCESIGTGLLSRVSIEGGSTSGWTRTFARPVRMARLVTSGYEPIHTLNGWPISLTRRVGAGRVILTTLQIEAWGDHQYRPCDAMMQLLDRAYVEPQHSLATAMRINTMPQPQIMTVTDTRNSTIWILIASVGTMLAATSLAVRRGRMEYSSIMGYATAVVATAALITIGYATRKSVRAEISNVRLLRIDEQGLYGRIDGVINYTNSQTRDLTIASTAGGITWPARLKGNRQDRAMIWSDLDQWRWQIPKVPPRTEQRVHLSQMVRLKAPVTARFKFGPDGLSGVLAPGQFRNVSTPILRGLRGDLLVQIGRDSDRGQIMHAKIDPEDLWSTRTPKPRGGSRASQHKSMARYELAGRMNRDRPVLTAWIQPDDTGLDLRLEANRDSLMLMAMPIHFDRPAPGTFVSIPPKMIGIDPLPGTANWPALSTHRPGAIRVRLQLPQHLMPLSIDTARLLVTASATLDSLQLFAPDDGTGSPLVQSQTPNKRIELDLSSAAPLLLADDGSLTIDLLPGRDAKGQAAPIVDVRCFVAASLMAQEP